MGLRNARPNFRQTEETHILENVIFNELKVRGYNVDVGVVTVNEKECNASIRKQLGIDFVCNKDSKRCYIQSAFSLPDSTKIEQELRPLILSGDFFKKIAMTKDSPILWYNKSCVLIMNVFDVLLNPDTAWRYRTPYNVFLLKFFTSRHISDPGRSVCRAYSFPSCRRRWWSSCSVCESSL